MHERGEQLPPEDPYWQGLQTALSIAERFKAARRPVYAQITWTPDQQEIVHITAREIIKATFEHGLGPEHGFRGYTITLRDWSSNTPDIEPEPETRKVDHYEVGHGLRMSGFSGYRATPAGLLEPFFDYRRCNSEERQRQLITAIVASGASDQPDLRRLTTDFRDSILKKYSPDDIDRYLQVTQGLEVLPAPLDKASISQFATRRIINDLGPRDVKRVGRKRLSDEEIQETVLKLEKVGLLDGSYFASPYAYGNPVFSEILHAHLDSERREETLRKLGSSLLRFAQTYMGNALSAHATSPNRHRGNTSRALANTKEHPQRDLLNPSKVISEANKITYELNGRRNETQQLLPLESIDDFRNVGEAFFRILDITRQPGTEHIEADIAADRRDAEIIDMILESVVGSESKRRVVTNAELARRYHDVSDEEFATLRDALQTGTPYPQLTKLYMQLVRKRKRA